MIINELTYQEIAVEAGELEGGIDLAFNASYFKQNLTAMQTGTVSGPMGTMSVMSAQHVYTDTGSVGAIVLGL